MPNTANFEVTEYQIPVAPDAAVMDMVIADINGDGYDDVIATYFYYPMQDAAIPLTILLGAADGSLTLAGEDFYIGGVPGNVWGRQIILEDFNEDGRPDIYIADHGFDAAPFPGAQNTLLLSTSDGRMVNATANLPQLTDFSHSAATGDFDGDGHLDIFVNNYNGGTAESTYILRGDGAGGFTQNFSLPQDILQGYYNSPASGVMDFDGDGDLDIVMTPNFTTEQDVRILLNDGSGNFAGPGASIDIPPIGIQDGVVDLVITDITGDGREDMIFSIAADNYASEGYLAIYVNYGDGVFVDETDLRVDDDQSPGWIQRNQLIDVNGDGALDIIQFAPSGRVVGPILMNTGTGHFVRLPSDYSDGFDRFTGAYEYDRIMGGDINGDGRMDLVSPRFNYQSNVYFAAHIGRDPGASQTGNNRANALIGDGSDETLSGLDGNDVIFASGGNDQLAGGAGHDKLFGGTGNDTLYGNSGNDVLAGGAGNDYLDGGTGTDTASWEDAAAGVTFRLHRGATQNTGGSGVDTLVSIENLTGSAYNDLLEGDDNANVLTGDAGNDKLRGKGGADTLLGGSGDDALSGGDGGDVLRGGNGNDDLQGDAGNDQLYGDAGDDRLTGGDGADTMAGGAGNDTYFADAGDTIVEAAGEGIDRVVIQADYTLGDNIEDLTLRSGKFTGTGNALDNTIQGKAGISLLYGMGGDDILLGGASDDKLDGGSGDDKLDGEQGYDIMTGGAGADRFAFGNIEHIEGDLIRDFSHAEGDQIVLRALDADTTRGGNQSFAFVGDAAFSNHAGELRYEFDGNGKTLLMGDVDGDGSADFTIRLLGEIDLVAGDIVGASDATNAGMVQPFVHGFADHGILPLHELVLL